MQKTVTYVLAVFTALTLSALHANANMVTISGACPTTGLGIERGDTCFRTDTNQLFIWVGSWREVLTAAAPISIPSLTVPGTLTAPTISGNTTLSNNATVSGTLSVTGASTLTGTVTTGGSIRVPDGTPTTPGYASSVNTATGMFFTGAQGIGFSGAGLASLILVPSNDSNSSILLNTSPHTIGFIARSAACATPGVNVVNLCVDESQNKVGGAPNDCILVAKLSNGTEISVATLVTDGGCP